MLLLAFFLRVAGLETTPPGPRFDEVLVFMEADRIQAGSRALFSVAIYEETLFHHILARAVEVLGKRLIVGRWLAAGFGLLALATLYPLARRAFGRRAAWLAVALMAVGLWPVLYSRFALRITCMLPLVTAGVYLFWSGVERPPGCPATARLVLAGLCLGTAVYTYGVGRYAPALLIAFAVYLLGAHRRLFRSHAAGIGLALLIALAIDAPLLLYLHDHPGVDQRFGQVSAPLDTLLEGDPSLVIEHAWRTLLMPIWQGDQEWLYNVARRPVFDPVTGVLFYAGLALCVARWRTPWRGALLAWLALGMGQAVLTWPAASFSHTITAQPVFYLLPALGADWGLGKLGRVLRMPHSTYRPFAAGACAALVAANLGLTVRDYFGTWSAHPNVRAEYQASLTAMARYLESHNSPAVAGGALVDAWNPSNAYGFGLIYRRPDRPVAWYNPAGALAWPPGPGPMTVALPRIDRPIPALATKLSRRFFDDAQLVYDEVLPGPSSGSRVFKVYEARGRQALDERLAALGMQTVAAPGGAPAIALPANLDNRFELLGYEVLSGTLKPGRELDVITYWETRRSFRQDLVAFTHLIGPDGKPYAQDDRLDVFTDSLYPGLAFAQLHRLRLPDDLPAGRYHIQVGMYRLDDLSRLPFLVEDRPVADTVRLLDVTVYGP